MTAVEDNLIKAISSVKRLFKEKADAKIVALTGSGISKGSGIPTFRGKDGLWKNYSAMQLATPQAFKADPKLVWEWYAWRIGIILSKDPNPAHHSLVRLQDKGLLDYVITQNVDSLHTRAGSKNILEVHGNILRARCIACSYKTILSEPPDSPPKCSECGSMLRPGVVWFGESLDHSILLESDKIMTTSCDVLLVIGTSAVVYPAASFPFIAKERGAIVLEFNIERTPASDLADYSIFGKSEETLPKFVSLLLEQLDENKEEKEK